MCFLFKFKLFTSRAPDDTNLSDLVERVAFELHPTFHPPVVEITSPPYEVTKPPPALKRGEGGSHFLMRENNFVRCVLRVPECMLMYAVRLCAFACTSCVCVCLRVFVLLRIQLLICS